jgi:CheY-like chemotaxis protein
LSIVSRIVNLLGLRLEVQSEVGKGTAFSLGLPASGATSDGRAHHEQGPQPTKGRAAARVHALLVEDDARVRNATRMLLKVEGYEVTAAASLSEATQHAFNHSDIALLVTDYHLAAGETGVQVITAVRGVLGPNLPAILVTGDTSTAVRELSVDSHLRLASKPINPDELMKLLRELVPG